LLKTSSPPGKVVESAQKGQTIYLIM